MESLAWAAGLFEGKGTISHSGGRLRLAVKTVNEEAVRRFGAAIGIGKVYGPYGPYESQLGRNPVYYWCADGPAAHESARMLLPWLGEACRAKLARHVETPRPRVDTHSSVTR